MQWCRGLVLSAALVLSLVRPASADSDTIRIGSKQFTESVLLGEVVNTLLRTAGIKAQHRSHLGGTRLVWEALRRGDIDLYPEYTGTIAEEILRTHSQAAGSFADLQRALAEEGVRLTAPLGFSNTYALAMRPARAVAAGIKNISDLSTRPTLHFGFSSEFLARGDGWQSLRQHYGLPQQSVRGMAHELAYLGLSSGDLDVIDVYTTDPEIAYYRLQTLTDDRNHFPEYLAVYLYRDDLAVRRPQALQVLQRLQGQINQEAMTDLNRKAKFEKRDEVALAAEFVRSTFGVINADVTENWTGDLCQRTLEHLWLVGLSLFAAVMVGIPAGLFCARRPRLGQVVINVIAVLQTIPALALLVFMIPLVGIGDQPAILAIFVYSVLPIVRNTCSGLQSIAPALIESALAIGLPATARLRLIELPLAARTIFAGIKTAAVINVGTATLGALVGAGGYGQPILTGIRLDDTGLILQGAIPAAVLAVLMQLFCDWIENRVLPVASR